MKTGTAKDFERVTVKITNEKGKTIDRFSTDFLIIGYNTDTPNTRGVMTLSNAHPYDICSVCMALEKGIKEMVAEDKEVKAFYEIFDLMRAALTPQTRR